jgi:glycosyltransferase involved in cell wall biosynthesis
VIVAVIPSFGRPALLARLLASLRAVRPSPPRTIVVDNLGDGTARRVVDEANLPDAVVLVPGRNLGTGGGAAHGFAHALADPAVTYCAQLDDDAVVEPGVFAELERVLAATPAGAATPMILRADGAIGWFPGLRDRRKWRVVLRARGRLLPEEYLAECGPDPVPFTWAAWPVALFKRSAIEQVGLPREDVWYQGTDLEYMLRIAAGPGNLWVPTARSRHLPPDLAGYPNRRYWRDCIGLQNCSYVFLRLPHGRLALRHLPGAYWRFLREWGIGGSALWDAGRCLYWGALLGRPAGDRRASRFRDRWSGAGGRSP